MRFQVRKHFLLLWVLPAVLLTGCSALHTRILPSNSDEQRTIRRAGSLQNESDTASYWLEFARRSRGEHAAQLSALLEAARLSEKGAAEAGSLSQKLNRAAMRRIVSLLKAEGFDLQPDPTIGGIRSLQVLSEREDSLDPNSPDELIPADQIRIGGLHHRTVTEGIGLPMVAWFRSDSPALAGEPGLPRSGMAIPTTAVATFTGRPGDRKARLEFVRTLKTETISVKGKTLPLATDFSAPIALVIARGKNKLIDLRGLFFAGDLVHNSGLFQFQPFNPDKIPVVFVHGLMSRPEAWTQALNSLMADPAVRKKYQFWFYLYPTGLPVWSSAAGLRSELDRFNRALEPRAKRAGKQSLLQQKVVIGHSMGGLISSILIREGGNKLWSQFSDVDFDSLDLSPEVKQAVRTMIFFRPRTDVSRVIFVATPHRGSPLALRPIAGFFADRIRLPLQELNQQRYRIVAAIRNDVRRHFSAPANSLRFLRADSPLVVSILKLPRDESIPLHSIIGDRGRNDAPEGSDGVVPFRSAHLPGVKSQKIVPSGHGANEHPEGIREMARILGGARSPAVLPDQ